MKLFNSLLFFFIVINFTYSQCPQSGLNIQSAICDSARNLKATSISCSQIKIQWKGSQSQTYIVNATGHSAARNSIYQPTVSNYSCDSKANCQATIAVKENTIINWGVQSLCSQNEAAIYGYIGKGPQINIPACSITNNTNANKTLVAFPNPTNRFLTVEYSGKVTASTRFTIYNESGKQMFYVPGNSVTRISNGYQFDLHNLTSGTYFLKLNNGDEVRQVKFVLIKN